jgi:hypothetical protein
MAAAPGAARELAARSGLVRRVEPYSTCVWDGRNLPRPVFHLDDFSAIPFLVDITGVEEYQHRARLRALEGDIYSAVSGPTPGYETYCVDRLGLPTVPCVRVAPVGDPLALARAWAAGKPLSALVERVRKWGGLGVHPFMGTEEVWSLAARVAALAQAPVSVIGPPPPVTWIANDKASFGELVAATLGGEWLVESRSSADAGILADSLLDLASDNRQVGLKRLRCASAMGNVVWRSADLLGRGQPAVERDVGAFLERTEWDGVEQVLAVVWEETDCSPSTQMWIPPDGQGPPRLEGIYEQILDGEHGVFVGSRPSTLPEPVDRVLAGASLAVAAALQAMGYVGRCSFDLLLVGDPEGDFRIKFVECNGRWGGTSTPMALLDRLVGAPRPRYRAQDFVRPELVGASFLELLAAVGDAAWSAETGRGRYLFYNTGPLAGHGKIDVISLGRTQEEAEEGLEVGLPRLLGLG